MKAKEQAHMVRDGDRGTRRLVPGSMTEAQRPRRGWEVPEGFNSEVAVTSLWTLPRGWCYREEVEG